MELFSMLVLGRLVSSLGNNRCPRSFRFQEIFLSSSIMVMMMVMVTVLVISFLPPSITFLFSLCLIARFRGVLAMHSLDGRGRSNTFQHLQIA